MPEQDEVRNVRVYGDKTYKKHLLARTTGKSHDAYSEALFKQAVVEHSIPPVYERSIHAQAVTFLCQRCHQEMTEVRFPGPVRYCSACAVLVKREKSRLRTQRSRQKAKERRTL